MRFIGRGRHRFSCSSFNNIANNNKPVPSSHASLFRHNSRSIVLNRHFFHAYNTPLSQINRCHGEIAYDRRFAISRRVVSDVERDREIKSNATSTPVTIDEWHLHGRCVRTPASGCRIILLVHILYPFDKSSTSSRAKEILFCSFL